MDTTSFDKTKTEIDGPMHTSLRHDSAHKHVTGSAEYIDDIPEPAGLIHGALGLSDRAHAEIVSMDLSEVEKTPGVLWVMALCLAPCCYTAQRVDCGHGDSRPDRRRR